MDLRKPHPKFDFFANWIVFSCMLVIICLGSGLIGLMFGFEVTIDIARQVNDLGNTPEEIEELIFVLKITGIALIGIAIYGLSGNIPKLKMKIPT